ncbi:MAG TPA: hypothetical protein VEH06_16560 [Candidatus Bathyarchaeia archaeon]|nr:hypothetical protein [Candidatus Bathyarchaeia archaeon]
MHADYIGTHGPHGDVKLLFNNPRSGTNTCAVEGTLSDAKVSCTISQGDVAHVTYKVEPPGGGGDNGGG